MILLFGGPGRCTAKALYKLLILVSFLLTSGAWSDVGPAHMEAGVGLVGQYLADYRGSRRYQLKALPVPYFLYYGRFLKADGRGLRGDFLATDRVEISLSVDGSLSGDSEGNLQRAGMPELSASFEVGPSLNVNLNGLSFEKGLSLNLPLRAVIAVDPGRFQLKHIGFLSNPRLSWRHPNLYAGWRVSADLGLVVASGAYHDYYYRVRPAYAETWRPSYDASGGYSGSFVRLAGYRQIGTWRFALSMRYDNLSGAVFEDSPLVETEHFASLSFAVIKTFWSNR